MKVPFNISYGFATLPLEIEEEYLKAVLLPKVEYTTPPAEEEQIQTMREALLHPIGIQGLMPCLPENGVFWSSPATIQGPCLAESLCLFCCPRSAKEARTRRFAYYWLPACTGPPHLMRWLIGLVRISPGGKFYATTSQAGMKTWSSRASSPQAESCG